MPRNDLADLQQIQDAFTELLRWAHHGDVRRSLLGAAAQTLSPNDLALLRSISRHGPVRASELASRQGVDKSTVTPQVRRLEDRGLVERHGDPGDRRAALLTVSEQGRQKLREIDEAGVQLFARALDGWPHDDRHALATLMRRLAGEVTDVPRPS